MKFSEKLIRWFEINKRNLPWRGTSNPYLIWLSEIILQQTRVEQGLPYYLKFVKKFPAIQNLALAEEDEILKLWQGLGYYTRARNLHYTAKFIFEKHHGKFPDKYNEILKLKGIGKYTAAAISSFAFNLPYPVVDGNVQRILARIFGITEPVNSSGAEKIFYALAESLIDKKSPAAFNQAMMEFGAIHCTPANPGCNKCIFKKNCVAFNTKRVAELPCKEKKVKQRNRYFNYLVIERGDYIYLKKRNANDIWKNLYEFPLIESEKPSGEKKLMNSIEWKNIFPGTNYKLISKSKINRHLLSHQKIFARFWKIKIAKKNQILSSCIEIKKPLISKYAVPRLIENYLDKEF